MQGKKRLRIIILAPTKTQYSAYYNNKKFTLSLIGQEHNYDRTFLNEHF